MEVHTFALIPIRGLIRCMEQLVGVQRHARPVNYTLYLQESLNFFHGLNTILDWDQGEVCQHDSIVMLVVWQTGEAITENIFRAQGRNRTPDLLNVSRSDALKTQCFCETTFIASYTPGALHAIPSFIHIDSNIESLGLQNVCPSCYILRNCKKLSLIPCVTMQLKVPTEF